jgi:hypothetical protein
VPGSNDRTRARQRRAISPADGERRAQRGLVPQYKIAAEKVLNLLADGRLHAVGIADPDAATQDDLQTIRRRGSLLILDAYQVKWSRPGETLIDSELRTLLAEMVSGHRAITRARAAKGAESIDRVICHLYTKKTASTAGLRGEGLAGEGRTLSAFLDAVWQPAQRGALHEDLDPKWRPYLQVLAEACELEPAQLLAMAPELRIECNRELAEDAIEPTDGQTDARFKDLQDIRTKLEDLVSHRDEEIVWLTAQELVERLGPEWTNRWNPRHEHHFPTAGPYEPVAASVAGLSRALDQFESGYVVLTGTPGSGKSTLLTRLLRTDDRLAASYYAYVPGNDVVTRGEGGAFLHDLYLSLTGRLGRRTPAPRGESLDQLRLGFREELAALGRNAQALGRTEIVLIDGLDHVERDPKPQHPLLNELPAPAEIPDGVLLVIGTRGLADLPTHLSRGLSPERHVELQPLGRAAVIRLCDQAGLGELGERLASLSGGHPLLLRTYIRLAEGLDAVERDSALGQLEPSHGEIWDFYETVWDDLEREPEVIELLGLISRLRGQIRRSWLVQTGSKAADLTRLERLRHLFDTRDPDSWRFFHSSFREFLLRRTSELDGVADSELHRAQHRALAERCSRSASNAPERFDELYHLLEAGEHRKVLATATPAYFREQVDAMRARDDVASDIRAAAASLAFHHDGLAAARLALSAHELRIREYQSPENIEFLELLVTIGQPELATEHLRAIDNGTVGHDRCATAMRLAQRLYVAGHAGEAMRVFEEHEPLDWLGGPVSPLRDPPSGPFGGLYAWSRAAAHLRGGDYFLTMLGSLRAPADHEPDWDEQPGAIRAAMIWCAAHQLIVLGATEHVGRLRAALIDTGDAGHDYLALLDYTLAEAERDVIRRRQLLVAIDPSRLPALAAVELADFLLDEDERGRAEAILATLDPPELPQRASRSDEERRDWEGVYCYWRLVSAIRGAPDPVQAIPDPDPEREYLIAVVHGARHLIALASLEGRARAGEQIASAELLACLRRLHSYWDAPRTDREAISRPGRAVRFASRRAVVLAEQIGEDALDEVLGYYTDRWSAQPTRLLFDGAELIETFAQLGARELSLRRSMQELETQLEATGSSPEDWVQLGPVWTALEDPERVSICCRRAVRHTLSLSSEKDTQLATWIELLRPLILGPDGTALTNSLLEAVLELGKGSGGGAPGYVAERLLEVLVPSDPDEAWRVAERLLDASLLGPDTVLEVLLTAAAATPSSTWWILVGELLVTLGAGPPRDALTTAAVAEEGLARQWLASIAQRVAVEGRPTERRSWRETILDASRAISLPAGDVPISARDLAVDDESPQSRGGPREPERPEQLTVEQLLEKTESEAHPSYEAIQNVRQLVGRSGELNDDQLARVLSLASGTENEVPLRVRLSARALSAEDVDRAWEHGMRALEVSAATDWQRAWAGGPILQLIPDLYTLDRARAEQAVFASFSRLAGSSDYFLSSVGESLDQYLVPLQLPAREVAYEVLSVARALLRDVAQLPDPASLRVREAPDPPAGDPRAAFDALTLRLLAEQHTVAWQAAQRVLLALAREGAGGPMLVAALATGTEVALRSCAVLESTAGELPPDDAIAQALARLARGPRLDVRRAAARCSAALGLTSASRVSERGLPAALRIELPARDVERRVLSGLEEATALWRDEIHRLAARSGVDRDALHLHVLALARIQLGSEQTDDDRLSREGGVFGWGYIKPSARAVEAPLSVAACELFDAHRIELGDALFAVRLPYDYDIGLLRLRPERRPAACKTFIPEADRGELYGRELAEIASGAEDRLALEEDGWAVLGERSSISLLDRRGHHELRQSGLLAPVEASGTRRPLFAQFSIAAEDYHALANEGTTHAVVWGLAPPCASPSGWLGLHPSLALAVGLAVGSEPFSWDLDGEPGVRSLWWRSGYERWNPYSDHDEVGEGWLVLASPAVLERFPKTWDIGWEVKTGIRGGDAVQEAEVTSAGLLERRR